MSLRVVEKFLRSIMRMKNKDGDEQNYGDEDLRLAGFQDSAGSTARNCIAYESTCPIIIPGSSSSLFLYIRSLPLLALSLLM